MAAIPAHTHRMLDIVDAEDGVAPDWIREADATILANTKVTKLSIPVTGPGDTDPDGRAWQQTGYNLFLDSARSTDSAAGIFQTLQEAVTFLCNVTIPTYQRPIINIAQGDHSHTYRVTIHNHPSMMNLLILGDDSADGANTSLYKIRFTSAANGTQGINCHTLVSQFKGFEILGNTDVTGWNAGIVVDPGANIRIDNVYLSSFLNMGIYLRSGSTAYIADSTINNISASNAVGIECQQATLRVASCIIQSVVSTGIHLYGGSNMLALESVSAGGGGPGAVSGDLTLSNMDTGIACADSDVDIWNQVTFFNCAIRGIGMSKFSRVKIAAHTLTGTTTELSNQTVNAADLGFLDAP